MSNFEEGFVIYLEGFELPMYLIEETIGYIWYGDKADATIFTKMPSELREFLKDYSYVKVPAIATREIRYTGAIEKFEKENG